VAGQSSVAEETKRKVDAETRGDMMFMFGILFCVVLVITVIMVCACSSVSHLASFWLMQM
jgi:hypothetical protein